MSCDVGEVTERLENEICSLNSPDEPVVIILASGTEVRLFDAGRGRWIFFIA